MSPGKAPSAPRPGVPEIISHRAPGAASTASMYVPICRATPMSWLACASLLDRSPVSDTEAWHIDPQAYFVNHRTMKEGPDISIVAALMGDPARANMLMAMMAGLALTATELAHEAR